MNKISEHISLTEATNSYTAKKKGIDNLPNEEQLTAMKLVADKVFEPLRKHFNVPIHIPSFFRSIELNQIIGGASGSQHTKGEAIDIDADRYGQVTNKEIFDYIKNNLDFDQLIYEYGDNKNPNWVHVSYKVSGNRNQIIQAIKDNNGKTKYINYEK